MFVAGRSMQKTLELFRRHQIRFSDVVAVAPDGSKSQNEIWDDAWTMAA